MKEVLTTIIESLVSDKNSISIKEVEGQKDVIYEVKVANSDMGKVIGKQGTIAKAIRAIMKSIAAKENKRVTVEFLD